jgi:molybdenum cofactor cytidylyltransferase
MPKIASIILAAGTSSRLGFPKQLVEYKGQTLVEDIVKNILSLNLESNICVTGSSREEVEAKIKDYDIITVYNKDFKKGMSESLKTGIRAVKEMQDIDAVMIALCDQPLIPSSHYQSLVEEYRKSHFNIICSKYDNSHGVPAIIDRKYFDELLDIEKGGAKAVITAHLSDSLIIDCSEAAFDIDTNADLESLQSEE